MDYDAYDVCSDCHEMQSAVVTFDALHPYAKRMFTIRYCKHLDVILTDDVKHAVGKMECRFPQKVRNEELYGR